MPVTATHATTLEYALVGLLDQRPHSGYDLRRVFATTPLTAYSDSPGAVYPALRRLEARGWVTAAARGPASGRRRRALRLTAAGRRALREWVALAPTRDEVVHGIDALYLRFAFMSQAAPPDVPRRFLATLRGLLEDHLADLERFHGSAAEHMAPTGRLVFEHGIDGVRHTLAWCARAARTLGPARSGRR
jgi:DNA-binding PadR family transcriptional regulator